MSFSETLYPLHNTGTAQGYMKMSQHAYKMFTWAYTDFRSPDKSAYLSENCFSYFSTKTYVVGTQKNRLDETVFEHPNTCFN